LNFSKKNALSIASDVATRRDLLERALDSHQQQQRRWQTMPMVSDSVSQKKK
jgi:hypothetical protein